jgi:hypothetical protein
MVKAFSDIDMPSLIRCKYVLFSNKDSEVEVDMD